MTGLQKENDERNSLFYAVFRLAEKTNPKAIIIENVHGLLTLYGGKAKKEIIELCDKMGYNCNPKLLYAPDYGVPQISKTVIFVASRKDLGMFEFREPTHSADKYVGCKDAIGDLPDLVSGFRADKLNYDKKPFSDYQKTMGNGNKVFFNHLGTQHTEYVVNVISQVP